MARNRKRYTMPAPNSEQISSNCTNIGIKDGLTRELAELREEFFKAADTVPSVEFANQLVQKLESRFGRIGSVKLMI